MTLAQFAPLLLLALPRAGHGAASVETLYVPDDCAAVAAPGDHLLIRMRVTDAQSGKELYKTAAHELQHINIGDRSTSESFNEGLTGMCAGEQRRLTFPTETMVGKGPNMGSAMQQGAVTVQAEIEAERVTTVAEYEIFDHLQSGGYDHVLSMIENHTGTNAVDEFSASALMVAVQVKAQVVIAALLNSWRPKVDVNYAKPSGHTAVFYCVAEENTSVLKALLKRGADPNAALTKPDSRGWTPLHFACFFENVKQAELLLAYGANPLAETADGRSVLDVASAAPYSVRKKLADILNEAVERMEEDSSSARADL